MALTAGCNTSFELDCNLLTLRSDVLFICFHNANHLFVKHILFRPISTKHDKARDRKAAPRRFFYNLLIYNCLIPPPREIFTGMFKEYEGRVGIRNGTFVFKNKQNMLDIKGLFQSAQQSFGIAPDTFSGNAVLV